MGVLQRFEQRLEGLVQGTFARVFRSEVQPVEIASALQRETDTNQQVVGVGRTLAPNDFVVELSGHDFERLNPYAEPLTSELAAMVREHAAEQGYSLVGPAGVRLEHCADLATGVFRVRSTPLPAAHPPPRDAGAPDSAITEKSVPAPGVSSHRLVLTEGGSTTAGSPGSRAEELAVPLTAPGVVIGRGNDAQLQLDDPGVSRRHAEVRLEGELAAVVDLGSTNGTFVNGVLVGRKELTDGDRIRVGTTDLIYRRGT